jgi:protocatechuate 3,4-dioxygenase beta subunit
MATVISLMEGGPCECRPTQFQIEKPERGQMKEFLSRRDAIRVGTMIFVSGAVSALEALLPACSAGSATSSASGTTTVTSSTSSSSCLASTNVTRGPYFVDNQSDPNITNDTVDTSILNRSDIRSDTKGSTGTQSGLPLYLNITVGSYSSSGCSPLANAQVHIWHCDAQGTYSDVQAGSNDGGADLTGENFLRGYQYTDSNGEVSFTTIYPGWYSGRAVHIHVKIRILDSSGNVTTEATTQLFFDDSTSDSVYAANSEYQRSGTRDTLNANDSIYSSESPALLVSLTGASSTTFTGAISVGVETGTIYGG